MADFLEKSLDDALLSRNARHIILPGFGLGGLRKLAASSALILGLGGLGSAAAQYLAGSGLGRLYLIDKDTVDSSNLLRQVLYTEDTIGQFKVDVARERLSRLNANLSLEVFREEVSQDNIDDYLQLADVVIDCFDKNSAKLLVHDRAIQWKKPLVHAGVLGFSGQVMSIIPGVTACLRCIFESIPEQGQRCSEHGIFSPLCGIAGSIQASEAIKILILEREQYRKQLLVNGQLRIGNEGAQFKFVKSPRQSCSFCQSSSALRA